MATEGEMAISTTAFIGWHSPAAVLFPAHLLGDNPLLTKAVTLVCCGIITRTHRVYWFLLSEKIGNCKQRQDQNMANSMIVVLVNVLQFREVRTTNSQPSTISASPPLFTRSFTVPVIISSVTKAINAGMKTVRFFSHCRVQPSHFDSLFFSNLQFVRRLLLPLAHVISRIEVHLSLPMKLIAAQLLQLRWLFPKHQNPCLT